MISHDAHIFVTGGAGFLGTALSEWAREHRRGWRFTIYSRDEAKHYMMRMAFPDHDYILGDVRDVSRLSLAMRGHDVVIHAAANKYVPQAETNVRETIDINVLGSENVAKAAIMAKVKQVVGISTDKACLPVNVYGTTKLLMERLFQEIDRFSNTQFNLVRYGNVIGSTGSVIPIFQRQATDTGVLQVTNPDMTRFWLTVREAVQLIDVALDEPRGGTVLIPRIPACSLEVTARAAALSIGVDMPKVEVIGHRFGEKLHEYLLAPHEVLHTMSSPARRDMGDGNIRLMRLHPLIEPEVAEPVKSLGGVSLEKAYTSEWPDRELGEEELADRIKEASTWLS